MCVSPPTADSHNESAATSPPDMTNGVDDHPYADRDPRGLSQGEWRVLMDYRVAQIEKRLDSVGRAVWTIAASVIAGVILIFVSTGGHP